MLCRACSTVLHISHPHYTSTYGLYYYYYRLHATIHGINTSVYSDHITTGSFFHFHHESRTGDRPTLYSSPLSFYFPPFFFFFFALQVSRLRDCGILCFIIRPHAHEAGEPCRYHFLIPFYLMEYVIYQAGLYGKGVLGILWEIIVIWLNTCRTAHLASLCPVTSMRLTFQIALLGVLSGISAINFTPLEERSSLILVSCLMFFLFLSLPFSLLFKVVWGNTCR